ncbi:MAG: adenylosuccinate lyase [Candidatus Asgardarchaeia archaeon]
MTVCPIDTMRYALPEMIKIFSEENTLRKWLEVEAALAQAHAEVGNIPKEAADEITKKASLEYVKLERVKEIEREIQHDLMAMVRALTEVCEEYAQPYVHLGVTSNDIKDTALALQLKEAYQIIGEKLIELESTLLELSERYKELVAVGRTHGQHANPITYGLKGSVYAAEIGRHIERFIEAKRRILVGKITGATGTQAALGEKGIEIQRITLEKLGLQVPLVTTQILQRDRHAEFLLLLALIASTLEKIATEIRNLQRTEIGEVEEFFEKRKQVGSSAMPSKRNPIKSERICGISRVIRYLAFSSLENIPLWHERDLTNSSSERIIIPHVVILTDYILSLMIKILKTLKVNEANVKKNLYLTQGLNLSESVLTLLVEKGLPRQKAHELIRIAAMNAVEYQKPFKDCLLEMDDIRKLVSEEDLDHALKPENYIGTAIKQTENAISFLRRKITQWRKEILNSS